MSSAGGVFQITSNDGKADRMLMASQLLTERIQDIMNKKQQAYLAQGGNNPSEQDFLPSLAEIQQTHLIHVQSRFKPFVSVALEYQKITPTAGNSQLGNEVIFSIPQFGDFLADMVVNVNLSASSCVAAPLPAVPADPADVTAAINQVNGSATLIDGAVLNQIDVDGKVVRDFEYLGYMRYDGKLLNAGELVSDAVYYCDFPGERIFKKVSIEVNGNPLDEYYTFSYVFARQFELKADKRDGYFRNVGQELPQEGKSVNFNDGARFGGAVFKGPQTPKTTQPVLSIWQKLMFWFNKDASNSLPSAAIPYGQRYIKVQLADAAQLVFRSSVVYNILKTTNKYVPDAVFTRQPDGRFDLSGGLVVRNTWYEYNYLPVYTNGTLNYPTIQSISLYANNIFAHPAVHDIYIKKIGFTLVRVHRYQQLTVNQSNPSNLMNQFKFPCEYIYLGLLPDQNAAGTWQATDWHKCAQLTHHYTKNGVYLDPAASKLFDNNTFHWTDRARTIDALEVVAHGVNLYQKLDGQFYSSYVPQAFGEHTLVTPNDDGVLMVNFALFPRVFQPSGHLNISRAREFYMNVFSSVVGFPNATGQVQSGQLIAEACSLNFLLVSDGSAIMRYST